MGLEVETYVPAGSRKFIFIFYSKIKEVGKETPPRLPSPPKLRPPKAAAAAAVAKPEIASVVWPRGLQGSWEVKSLRSTNTPGRWD